MASWLVQYGNKDRHIETALATFLSFFVAIWYVFYTGFLTDVPSLDSVVSSSYVSDEILALFSTACAILRFVTHTWLVLASTCDPDSPFS